MKQVYIVDDDQSVRDGFSRLLRAAGYAAATFDFAEAVLLRSGGEAEPCCIVLDVMMPGMSRPRRSWASPKRRSRPTAAR
jgi:FixJ family two-component response regulator